MKTVAAECQREKNRIISRSSIKWEEFPKKILIVHKETDLEFISIKVEELAKWLSRCLEIDFLGIFPAILKDELNNTHKSIQFFSDPKTLPGEIDLIITLGGDGTVLLAAWLFQSKVPPIIPFHFGTLGFLTIFNWENFSNRLEKIFTDGCRFNSRMRLECKTHKIKNNTIETFSVLNEIVIERGASPFISILDIYGDDKFLTKIQADGVAIATPTGSTAYSVKLSKKS